MSLRVGVLLVQNLPYDRWRSRVLELEQLGYDGVYVWDHLVHRTQEPTDPLFDGLTLLAAAAAAGVLLDDQVLAMEPWPKAEQVQRFSETVQVVDATLRGATSYDGEHWSGQGVTMAPSSVQRARLLDEAAREAGRDPSSIRRSVLIGSRDWPALSSPEAFREAVLRYAEIGVTEIVLVHPDHPAEEKVAHGYAAPGIVRRLAEEVLPSLRDELA